MSAPEKVIEANLLAEEKHLEDFTNSTLVLNDVGPQCILQIGVIEKMGNVISKKNAKIAEMVADYVSVLKRGIISTRSREGRYLDAVTINRVKYGVQSFEQQKSLLARMMGGAPPPSQQQQQGQGHM